MKNCRNCGAWKSVYERGGYLYWKNKKHYCTVREKLTGAADGCEKWKRKTTAYDLSARRFDEAEKDIEAIRAYAENP